MDREESKKKRNPPQDRLNLVYFTFLLHGIGALIPWNMFITAKDYFVEYKLNSYYTAEESKYAANFLPWIGFASQVPCVIFNWLNIFIRIGGSLSSRIIGAILGIVFIFVLTIIFAMVDSSNWPDVFFWTTMASVVVLNIAAGVYQNTAYGMAAPFPFKYTGAVVLGSNISGTFTAIINLITLATAPNARTSAIFFFITAIWILFFCFSSLIALPLNKFYSYNQWQDKTRAEEQKSSEGQTGSTRPPYWLIFKQCFPQCFNVFFIFFVTLTIFPTVHSDITQIDSNFIISPKYFVAITCFLTFNLTAMLGSLVPSLFTWPGPRFLWIPALLRFLFIPFFLFCNYQPLNVTRTWPVYISNDWAYWTGAVLFGLSSGYFSSLAMMYCGKAVKPEHADTAGMFGAACLITGIFCGINFSLVMPILV